MKKKRDSERACGRFSERKLGVIFTSVFLLLLLPFENSRAEGDSISAEVYPKKFIQAQEPLVVSFSRSLGKKSGQIELNGEKYFSISPKVPGIYRWLSPRQLGFKPLSNWPVRSKIEITAAGNKFFLYTLLPKPSKIVPALGQRDLRSVREIALLFLQPIPLPILKRALELKIQDLPAVNKKKAEILSGWTLIDRGIDKRGFYTYKVIFPRQLPPAKKVYISLSLTLPQSDGAVPIWESYFSTRSPFFLKGVRCGSNSLTLGGGKGDFSPLQAMNCGSISLGEFPKLIFSRPLGKNNPGLYRKLVRVFPPVSNLTYRINGNRLELKGKFSPNTLYRLKVGGVQVEIVDDTGQKLIPPSPQTAFFYFGELIPAFKAKSSKGILERRGPQMLAYTGAGLRKVLLRIYPLRRTGDSLWPFPDGGIEISSSELPKLTQHLKEFPRATWQLNREQLKYSLANLSPPQLEEIIELPPQILKAPHRLGINLKPYLEKFLKKGINQFIVAVQPLKKGTVFYRRIQVTDLSLTTVERDDRVLFAVTSLATAEPVEGAEVSIQGIAGYGKNTRWQTLWTGKTDKRGFVEYKKELGLPIAPRRLVVKKGSDLLLLDLQHTPPIFYRNHWWSSYKPWLAWLDSLIPEPEEELFRAHLFTDRPIYRPGEEVHIKGVVRRPSAGSWEIPKKSERFSVRVRGVTGRSVDLWEFSAGLSEYGTFYRKFRLPKGKTGYYRVSVYYESEKGDSYYLSSTYFRVEDYKIPKFEVRVLAPQKVRSDEPFKVSVSAQYFSGGPVSHRPVHWTVSVKPVSYPLNRYVREYGEFFFSSDFKFSGQRQREEKLFIQEDGKLNLYGNAELKIDPTVFLDLTPRKIFIESAVTGDDGRTIRGYGESLILPPFILGVRVKERFKLKVGALAPEIVALGIDGKALKGLKVRVELLRREWHAHLVVTDFARGKVRYETNVVDKLVERCELLTEAHPSEKCKFNLSRGGVYLLRLKAKDKLGRVQSLKLDLFVRDKKPMVWEKSRVAKFKISTEKNSYRPGEMVKVLLRSPFQTGRALLIVETSRKNIYRWVEIRGGKGIATFRAEGDFAPGVRLYALILKGRTRTPLEKFKLDPGRPQSAAATKYISIKPLENLVKLAMNIPSEAAPGQTMDVELNLSTPDGKPLAGEVTLWAVDKAVLSLARERNPHPVKTFVKRRDWTLALRDTRNWIEGKIPELAERIGGGARLRRASRRAPVVRKNFKTVAFFLPSIKVGPSGKVKVSVKFPDDLTTYVVRAVAVSGRKRFGLARKEVMVRLPVMLQSVLPPFARYGDLFRSGALARVSDGKGGPATVKAEASGLQMVNYKPLAFQLHPVKALEALFLFRVPLLPKSPEAFVTLSITRTSDGQGDAFRRKIQLKRDVRRQYILREFSLSDSNRAVEQNIQWPEPIREGSQRVRILLAVRGDVLRLAAHLYRQLEFPYGCTEQRLSQAYPIALLFGIFKRHAQSFIPQEKFKAAVENTLSYLNLVLTPQGLLALWPGDRGDLRLSAYALLFIAEAQKLGFSPPSRLKEKLLSSLQQALRSDYRGIVTPDLKAEILYSLSKNNIFLPGYIDKLYLQRNRLSTFAKSLLLSVMYKNKNYFSQYKITSLASELESSVSLKRENSRVSFVGLKVKDSYPLGGWDSEERTLAALLMALAQVNPSSPAVTAIREKLLSSDSEKLSTQSNAWLIAALGQLLRAEGKVPTLPAQLHRKELIKLSYLSSDGTERTEKFSFDSGRLLHRKVLSDFRLPIHFSLLDLQVKEPLWVQVEYSYLPSGPAFSLYPLHKGISVEKRVSVFGPKGKKFLKNYLPKKGGALKVKRGRVIEEEIVLKVNKDLRNVVLEIPVAAGIEVLDPSSRSIPKYLSTPSAKDSFRPSFREYLRDKVRFYFNYLPRGRHFFHVRGKALVLGKFSTPPARAELMYRRWVFGRSSGYLLEVGK